MQAKNGASTRSTGAWPTILHSGYNIFVIHLLKKKKKSYPKVLHWQKKTPPPPVSI